VRLARLDADARRELRVPDLTTPHTTDEPTRKDEPTGLAPHLALVAVQVFFGTWPIVGKIVLRVVPSTGLVALRVVGATLAFIFLQRNAKRFWLERRSDYARIALYSLLGVVLNQLLYVKGLSLSTAVNATILGTMIPVFALLVAVLLGREKFSARVATGVVVAACGAIYLVNPSGADFSGARTLGNLCLVANCIFYGAYIAISQDTIRRYGALLVITWVFIFACIATLPLGAYNLAHVPLAHIGWKVWLSIIYIVLVPTVGAYYLNAWALGRVAPSVVAVYIYLQPLIGLALAPLILGESLNARIWVASALIFVGVGVVTLRRRTRDFNEVSERPDALSH
jgi:drug/metabolite transporter (DMT)-like permease